MQEGEERKKRRDGKGLTSLDDTAGRADVETGENKGNVGEVEDLGTVGQGKSPELGGRTKEIDKAVAGAGADLGTVGTSDEVGDVVDAEAGVENEGRVDDEGQNMRTGLG